MFQEPRFPFLQLLGKRKDEIKGPKNLIVLLLVPLRQDHRLFYFFNQLGIEHPQATVIYGFFLA
jgi:hypothetical protein